MDVTNGSRTTSQHNQCSGMAIDDGSSREEHVNLVLLDSLAVLYSASLLSDTLTFTSQDSLVDTEAVAVDADQTAIGGHAVTHSNVNHITGDQFLCLNLLSLSIPNNLGFVGRVFLKCRDSLLGAAFLGNTDNRVKDKNSQNLGRHIQLAPQINAMGGGGGRLRTHHDGVNKGSPVVALFEKSQHKGYGRRTQQDKNKLIFELFQNQLPERGRRLFLQS